MFGLAKGPTVVRQTIAREFTTENTDGILMAQPIPGGSTIDQISLNFLLTSKHSMDTWKWTKYTLHGALVGFPNPNHGFGVNVSNYDTMWDNYIPKDTSPTSSMTDFTNDSFPDSSMTSSTAESTNVGAIESGNPNNDYGEISGNILSVESGPEFFFAREKRLDVSNGIIVDSAGDAGKYIAIDKYVGQSNKSYYLSPDRYWYALMAVGFPQFEATSEDFDQHPLTEFGWAHLAWPEISTLEGLLNAAEDSSTYDNVMKMLETYYIDADIPHDIGESDGPQEHVVTLESTINYRRPRFEPLQLNANAGQG